MYGAQLLPAHGLGMMPYLVSIHGVRAAVRPHGKGIHALHAVRRVLVLVQGHALQALLQGLSTRLLPLLLGLLQRRKAHHTLIQRYS